MYSPRCNAIHHAIACSSLLFFVFIYHRKQLSEEKIALRCIPRQHSNAWWRAKATLYFAESQQAPQHTNWHQSHKHQICIGLIAILYRNFSINERGSVAKISVRLAWLSKIRKPNNYSLYSITEYLFVYIIQYQYKRTNVRLKQTAEI